MTLQKNVEMVRDRLNRHGIELVSTGHQTGRGHTEIRVRRLGVEAKCYVGLHNVNGRHLDNTVRTARGVLRQRGAVFTAAELAELPEEAPAVEQKARKRPFRHLTRLNDREKADMYALVKDGTDFLEACRAYKISVSTGERIMKDGDGGIYNMHLDPKYRPVGTLGAVKPTIEIPRESYTDAPAEPAAPLPGISAPSGPPFKMVVTPPKVSPLDPRLLELAASVKLLQERGAELKAKAEALGIDVTVVIEAHWA